MAPNLHNVLKRLTLFVALTTPLALSLTAYADDGNHRRHSRPETPPPDKPDDAAVVRSIQKHAAEGMADFQANLALLYADGWDLEKDPKQAVAWAKKAAAQDSALGQYTMGFLYLYGIGVEKDPLIAAEWIKKAVRKKEENAQYTLGMMHMQGIGVEKDLTKYVNLVTDAAKQGQSDAIWMTATQFHNTPSIENYDGRALEWANKGAKDNCMTKSLQIKLQQAQKPSEQLAQDAANGNADAQFALATHLANGTGGFKKDRLKADQWYKKAADKGCIPALNTQVWAYATSTDVNLYNPTGSLKYADRLEALEDTQNDPHLMDTIAAAYAANSKFDEAIAIQEHAVYLFQRMAHATFLNKAEARLKLYRKHQPYQEEKK
ncbi:TPA: hypothetical protein DDW35_13345 [Candidatus Sumerlaeota bacterium]|jgi:TPR repeat protein|nr:hypothetical protein [Candidatus Sumerlaeota bacterium]